MPHCLSLLLLSFLSLPVIAGAPPYVYWRLGHTDDANPTMRPGIVLKGGGGEVDTGFQWLCELAGQGDILVIRAAGADGYNPYLRKICPAANSIATLIIPSRVAANDAFVTTTLKKAEAVWISGGDQSDYINFWKGTRLQEALNTRIAQGMPLGGGSAGMMVLTPFVYSAQEIMGAPSSLALANPFNRYMSFNREFLQVPTLEGTIGDTHLITRDRMGRVLAFLCHVQRNGWAAQPRAIAISEGTAILLDPTNGIGRVVGEGPAYFLRAPGRPEVCRNKAPLTYRNIAVYRVGAGGRFDLRHWKGEGGTAYTVSAVAGALISTQGDESPY